MNWCVFGAETLKAFKIKGLRNRHIGSNPPSSSKKRTCIFMRVFFVCIFEFLMLGENILQKVLS